MVKPRSNETLGRRTWFAFVATIACTASMVALPLFAQYGPPVDNDDYDESNEFVYLDDEVIRVEVTMDEADLLDIIADPFSDDYKMATVRVVSSQSDETVEEVGIRARGNTARGNMKFPWKLSFNEFSQGRRFHGVKKFNLASDAGDPSLVRSKTMWDLYRAAGVPSSRASHVHLIINDGSLVDGVYLNVEQVNDDFVEAWFGSEAGDLYKCRFKDVPASLRYVVPGTPETYEAFESYEEKSDDGSFVALADFIEFINFATDQEFRDGIGDRLNVDGFLRAMAADVAAGNWDGYWFGGNNYYLYQNTEAGNRFEYIPWDLDQAFGMDYFIFPVFFGEDWATRDYEGWGDGGFGGAGGPGQPPLIERILAVPEYDRQIQRYAREFSEGPLSIGANDEKLETFYALLEPLIFQGSFSGPTMDNGFTVADFLVSFDEPASYAPFAGATRERQGYVRANYPSPAALAPLRVNEAVADNETIFADDAGDFDDYFEIYNDSEAAIDIGGMYLTDTPGNPKLWPIPEGTVVPAKGFVLFWADDEDYEGILHTNFKLSNDGEGVWLYDRADNLNVRLDGLVFPELDDDEAYGRAPDGSKITESLAAGSPDAVNVPPSDPFALRIDGFCPGTQTVYTSNGSPDSQVVLFAATAEGSAVIDGGTPCDGTLLGLADDFVGAGPFTTDVNGKTVVERVLPEAVCGALFVQAIDTTTCAISEVVSVE